MSETKRRKYTQEFKAEAVRLAQKSDRPVAQVARELGIAENVLYRWMTQHRQAAPSGTTVRSLKAEREDLMRLRRELERITKERDFLKQAAAFFAREHKWNTGPSRTAPPASLYPTYVFSPRSPTGREISDFPQCLIHGHNTTHTNDRCILRIVSGSTGKSP